MLQGFAKHGEYVDFGESWLVYLTQQSGKKILVDDKEVILSYTGSKQVFIKPEAVVVEVTCGNKVHTHYEHKDTKAVMDKSEYNNILYGKFYDDEEDEYFYPSLEAEFEHRTQVRQLKDTYIPAYHVTEDVIESVVLTCAGSATTTGNPFIETALAYSKAKFSSSGFYRVNWSGLTAKVLTDFIQEFSLQESFTNSTHSNVQYAKIKGNFIINDKILGSAKDEYSVYDNLSLAKEAVEAHTKSLRNYLYTKIFGDNIILNKATLGGVVRDLNSIKSSLASIEVKQKSYSSKNILLGKINKLLEDYQNLTG